MRNIKMESKFFTRITLLLALMGSIGVQGEGEVESDFEQLQPLENEVLDRLIEKDDGPFERKIKQLLAEYILATAVDSANNATIGETSDSVGRALQGNYYPAPPPQQQQPQIVYVYGTTPPPRNSNERTRRTKPPRTHRTRRPGHHHSSEERATQPPQQQPVYIYPPQQQQPPYNPQYPPQNQPQYPPQNQPQYSQNQPQYPAQTQPQYPTQQQPAYQQPQQQRPLDLPQDSITGQGQPSSPSSPPTNNSLPTQQYPQAAPAPYPPQYQQPQQSYPAQPQQPAAPPVQVVYIQPTTLAPTGPTTTPRPRPSQQHVYNQVNNILDNVSRGNITGIVDQALGIRAPMPTRNFVNGILNTVFCNPINRLLGRCRGP